MYVCNKFLGLWLVKILMRFPRGGGWAWGGQHKCCSRKIKQMREGWAELCHTGTFTARAYSTLLVLVCFYLLVNLISEHVNEDVHSGMMKFSHTLHRAFVPNRVNGPSYMSWNVVETYNKNTRVLFLTMVKQVLNLKMKMTSKTKKTSKSMKTTSKMKTTSNIRMTSKMKMS